MENEFEKVIIGFSGFILYEQCYEYNENACYISDSKDSALQFMLNCGYSKSDFRLDEITMSNLIDDYGCSSGEYAMEKLVFEKFKKNAEHKGLEYTSEDWDMGSGLKIVDIYLARYKSQ